MPIDLTVHSELALRESWLDQLIDDGAYAEAMRFRAALGVKDGDLVLTSRDGSVSDDVVNDVQAWADRMPMSRAPSTRRRYANHVLRLVARLEDEEVNLSRVDEDLLRGWALTRKRGRSDNSWNPEESALISFFDWLASPDNPNRRFLRSPWPTTTSGGRTKSLLSSRRSTMARRVRMLDAVEWSWFNNVGLLGEGADPQTPSPRFPKRDGVLGDLLVTTGARISEARVILIDEVPVPTLDQRGRPWPSLMLFAGGRRSKTRGGFIPLLPEVSDRLWEWWESPTREHIVSTAQETLRRRLNRETLFVVEEVTSVRGVRTFAGTWLGRDERWSADALPAEPASWAVRLNGNRIEPLTVWQTDANGGRPLSRTSLEKIFAEATQRVAATAGHPLGDDLLRWGRSTSGQRQVEGGVTPHMARHTAVAGWHVELNLEVERRAKGAPIRRHTHLPSVGPFDPAHFIQKWLRHSGPSTLSHYETWVDRHDWSEGRALGDGVLNLIARVGATS